MEKEVDTDSATKQKIVLAVIVDHFLPDGNVWIWRQMQLSIKPELVIARVLSNQEKFQVRNVIALPRQITVRDKIRYKLWFFFRLFYYEMDKKSFNFFKSALVRSKINLVHIHFGTVACEYVDLMKELKLNFIVTFHGFDATSVVRRWPAYRQKLQAVFESATKIIAVSNFVRERLLALGCPAAKIDLSYLGVPDSPRDVIRVRKDTFRFLHLGSFVEKKGVPDLVRAFIEAFRDRTDVELVLVGGGLDMDKVKKIVKENPNSKVIIRGPVSSELIWDEFRNADVFVLNSRMDSNGATEGLPIALLEAMSAGLPVISTRHAGIPEAVIDGRNGILVEEKDDQALVDAMRLMASGINLDRFGEQSVRIIADKFRLDACNVRLEQLYEQAFNEYYSIPIRPDV